MAKEYGDFCDEMGAPLNDEQEKYEVKVEVDIRGRKELIDVRVVRFQHSDHRVVIETESE